jgi:hypothetical protein
MSTHRPNASRYQPPELIVPHGYPLQEHFVTTRDGYILRLFRVPHGRHPPAPPTAGGRMPGSGSGSGGSGGSGSGSGGEALAAEGSSRGGGRGLQQQQQQQRGRQRRPVVHLQHGLLGAGSDWALNGPGLSLAFVLADAGGAEGRRARASP